jgi:hypothetical protein
MYLGVSISPSSRKSPIFSTIRLEAASARAAMLLCAFLVALVFSASSASAETCVTGPGGEDMRTRRGEGTCQGVAGS